MAEPEQLQREIEQTREQLGDTVEALAQKTDVKAQARQRLQDTRASVSEKRDELLGQAKEASPGSAASLASRVSQAARARPLPVAVVGAVAFGFLAGRLTGASNG
jgi:cell division septum initiation protein DivIVA